MNVPKYAVWALNIMLFFIYFYASALILYVGGTVVVGLLGDTMNTNTMGALAIISLVLPLAVTLTQKGKFYISRGQEESLSTLGIDDELIEEALSEFTRELTEAKKVAPSNKEKTTSTRKPGRPKGSKNK